MSNMRYWMVLIVLNITTYASDSIAGELKDIIEHIEKHSLSVETKKQFVAYCESSTVTLPYPSKSQIAEVVTASKDKNFILINVGTHLVNINDKVYIFRNTKYIAALQITATYPEFSVGKILINYSIEAPQKGDIISGNFHFTLISCYKSCPPEHRDLFHTLLVDVLANSNDFWRTQYLISALCDSYKKEPVENIILKFQGLFKEYSYNQFIVELFANYLISQGQNYEAVRLFTTLFQWSDKKCSYFERKVRLLGGK